LCIIAAVIAADVDDGDVLVLTKNNFDETVKSSDLILVEFYAPWCGHCKKLAPEYGQAATILKKNDPPVLLGKVDATVDSELGQRFSVTGYPTLKIFRRGVVSDYKGPRDSAGIVAYMKKQVGDSAKTLSTSEEYDKFVENQDISIIGFFPSKSGSLYKAFLEAADQNRDDFRFGLVTDNSIMEQKKFKQGVVVIRPFDDKVPAVFTGKENANEITSFVYANSVPFIGELTKANEARYKKLNKPIVKAYFDVDWKSNLKRTNYYVNRLKKAIDEVAGLKEKVSFAVVKRANFKDELDKFGLAKDAEVGVAIDDFAGSLKYRLDKEFSVDNLKEFFKNYLENKIKPHIKSEPIPEKNDAPVKIVVGESFNDIVLDKTKDVLIEMYAPWCGHCKKLEPIYTELAEKLGGIDSVVIAKMDATANDSPHPKYQARGYPTIFFAPANNKDAPLTFSGDRSVAGFRDYLKKNAAIKWPKDEL